MTPGQPDVIEQIPAGGGQNRPEGGAYGEGVALERLEQSLPDVGAEQAAAGPSPAGVGASPVPPGQGDLPPEIFGPTTDPDTPVSQPLGEMAPNVVGSPEEQVIQVLERLSNDTGRTAESREWARLVLDRLIRAQE